MRNGMDWPLADGRLTCITCHDLLPGCDRNAVRPPENTGFLRLVGADRTRFCASCHVETAHARLNPHKLRSSNGRLRAEACEHCHAARPPEPSNAASPPGPVLIADELVLCRGCHKDHVDFFRPGHIAAQVTPRIRAVMLERDRQAGLDVGADPLLLPLLGGDRIGCSTCHDPHSVGWSAEDEGSVEGAAGQTRWRESIALRIPGTDLCVACHAK